MSNLDPDKLRIARAAYPALLTAADNLTRGAGAAYTDQERHVLTLCPETGATIRRYYPIGSRLTGALLVDNAYGYVLPRLDGLSVPWLERRLREALYRNWRYWGRWPVPPMDEPSVPDDAEAYALRCDLADTLIAAAERAIRERSMRRADWDTLRVYADLASGYDGWDTSYAATAREAGIDRSTAIRRVNRARAALQPLLRDAV